MLCLHFLLNPHSPEFALLALGLRCLGRGLTISAFSGLSVLLFTTVEDDGVGESGLVFSSPELLPVDPELTPLELFRTRPLLEPLGTAEKLGLFTGCPIWVELILSVSFVCPNLP